MNVRAVEPVERTVLDELELAVATQVINTHIRVISDLFVCNEHCHHTHGQHGLVLGQLTQQFCEQCHVSETVSGACAE